MSTIADAGHYIDTSPELEFGELVGRPKLSAAEIVSNVTSWLQSDVATEPFDRHVTTADEFELAMVRREALQEVLRHLTRLGAVEFL